MNAVRQRTQAELLGDAQAAAQRLSIASRSWPSFPPGRAALDEAANTLEGLRRTVGELRAIREQEAGYIGLQT